MKNLRNMIRTTSFLFVIAGLLLPGLATAQNSGLQNCTITATGTGKTTGDVVTMTINNPSDKEVKDFLGPYYIPSGGSYQPYITMEKVPVTVPPNKTVFITLKGYCADITKPAAGENDIFNPINTWINIGDTHTGFLSPSQLNIDPESHPEVIAPYFLGALEAIMKAYDGMKEKGDITTPFSQAPEKEREAVIQQTFWIYSAETRQKPYTKEQFAERTYAQFQNTSNINPSTLPTDKKQQLDNGIDNFWNTFQAVGTEAKILSPSTTAVAQLYDVRTWLSVFDRDHISIWYNGKQVEPKKDDPVQVYYYGNKMIILINGLRLADFDLANDVSESVQNIIERFSDITYAPPDVGCDSLTRICKKTAAFNVFWGDIYSVVDQKLESKKVAGITLEKGESKSLLITRGWKIDCCTGEYSLNLTFQAMHGGNDGHNGAGAYNVNYSRKLKVGKPCPINCPECQKKCNDQKILEEETRKRMEEARKKWEEEHKGN